MRELLFFSKNKNKIFEIQNLLYDIETKLLDLSDFPKIQSPLEIGKTFEENAKIKAMYGYKIFNKPCFADDSGICIEAMQNDPGIRSKEFLEINGSLSDAFKKIIYKIKKSNNDNAFFKTSICLVLNEKKILYFNGQIEGKISRTIKGVGGFGYDPIFIPEKEKETFAEMSTNKKNSLSHRYIAIQKLKEYLSNLK